MSGRSPKKTAPAGTSSSGLSDVMNSAWAMLVWGMALKNTVMFSPKQSPTGIIIFHVASDGGRTPVCTLRRPSTIHHSTADSSSRQNAMAAPGTPAHLTIDELLEKQRTPPRTQRMPTSRRSRPRRVTGARGRAGGCRARCR